jgi:hypothetical protein
MLAVPSKLVPLINLAVVRCAALSTPHVDACVELLTIPIGIELNPVYDICPEDDTIPTGILLNVVYELVIIIFAVPSKLVPFISLAVCNAVAVDAFPVSVPICDPVNVPLYPVAFSCWPDINDIDCAELLTIPTGILDNVEYDPVIIILDEPSKLVPLINLAVVNVAADQPEVCVELETIPTGTLVSVLYDAVIIILALPLKDVPLINLAVVNVAAELTDQPDA